MIMGPVLGAQVEARTPGEQFRQLMRTCVQSVELKEAETFEDAYYYLMSGFCVFVLDGCPRAMVMGIQGWTKRSTDEPESESNVRGAKECFVESVNDNKALLRKRMKTHHLKLRQIQLGTAAPTPVVLAFLDDRAAFEHGGGLRRTGALFGHKYAFLFLCRRHHGAPGCVGVQAL